MGPMGIPVDQVPHMSFMKSVQRDTIVKGTIPHSLGRIGLESIAIAKIQNLQIVMNQTGGALRMRSKIAMDGVHL